MGPSSALQVGNTASVSCGFLLHLAAHKFGWGDLHNVSSSGQNVADLGSAAPVLTAEAFTTEWESLVSGNTAKSRCGDIKFHFLRCL